MISLSSPIIQALIGLLILLLLVALVLWLRRRSVKTIDQGPSATWPKNQEGRSQEPQPISSAPRYKDLIPERNAEEGYSVQLQTATHNLRIEKVKDQLRFIVDGVTYTSLSEIPQDKLRKYALKLLDNAFHPGAIRPNMTLRQVIIGNQTAIEQRSPEHAISIQRTGNQTRYIVDGMTYYKLRDITDPDLIKETRELQKKML